jgi:hypothetical protein
VSIAAAAATAGWGWSDWVGDRVLSGVVVDSGAPGDVVKAGGLGSFRAFERGSGVMSARLCVGFALACFRVSRAGSGLRAPRRGGCGVV